MQNSLIQTCVPTHLASTNVTQPCHAATIPQPCVPTHAASTNVTQRQSRNHVSPHMQHPQMSHNDNHATMHAAFTNVTQPYHNTISDHNFLNNQYVEESIRVTETTDKEMTEVIKNLNAKKAT